MDDIALTPLLDLRMPGPLLRWSLISLNGIPRFTSGDVRQIVLVDCVVSNEPLMAGGAGDMQGLPRPYF
jgi:hypothetical protein